MGTNTALLQFDVTTLPAGLTSNQVSRATLTVFVNRVNTGGMVNLSPVISAWSEPAVTYATIPTIGAPFNGFPAAGGGQYITLDVTSLVQGWVTAPATNFGFALSSTTANVSLDSKENDKTGHAASLDITITSMGAVGPTGPQGPIGVSGAAGAPGIGGPIGSSGPAGPGWSGWCHRNSGNRIQLVFGNHLSGRTGCILLSQWLKLYCTRCQPEYGSPTQSGTWQLIAQAGAQGVAGPVGPGATGATGSVTNGFVWSNLAGNQGDPGPFCGSSR